MLTFEQMATLLQHAAKLPHTSTVDVFLTAASMAEVIEGTVPPPPSAKAAKPKGFVATKNGAGVWGVSPLTGKPAPERLHERPSLTVKHLREIGLDYGSVAECAYDLVTVKGMTVEAAAKRMVATTKQVRMGLLNYKQRGKGTRKADAKDKS